MCLSPGTCTPWLTSGDQRIIQGWFSLSTVGTKDCTPSVCKAEWPESSQWPEAKTSLFLRKSAVGAGVLSISLFLLFFFFFLFDHLSLNVVGLSDVSQVP